MRKISMKAAKNFHLGITSKLANTVTKVNREQGKHYMYLFGHNIATLEVKTGNIYFDFCDWETPTTRGRMNGIVARLTDNVRIRQIKGQQYIVNSKYGTKELIPDGRFILNAFQPGKYSVVTHPTDQ